MNGLGKYWFVYVVSEDGKLWENIGTDSLSPADGFALCESYWRTHPDCKIFQITHRNGLDDYTDIIVKFGHNNEFDPPGMGD